METPREFIKFSGKKENKKWVREYEESARKRFVEGGEKNAQLEKLLQTIDFGLLRSLFEEVIKKTRLDSKAINFLGLDRIIHQTGDTHYFGIYATETNLIGFDFEVIKSRAEEEDFDIKLLLLRFLCHEEAHAVSKSSCYGIRESLRDGVFIGSTTTGLQIISSFSWVLLDEAVTEKLSGEIFEEYLRVSPDFAESDAVGGFREKYKSVYAEAVDFLNVLIVRIVKDKGVSEEVVWGGVL